SKPNSNTGTSPYSTPPVISPPLQTSGLTRRSSATLLRSTTFLPCLKRTISLMPLLTI
ncbi:hypothetical protein M9458_021732, partial [Cirrhinus mrigala]